jgi:hypothetical protein
MTESDVHLRLGILSTIAMAYIEKFYILAVISLYTTVIQFTG